VKQWKIKEGLPEGDLLTRLLFGRGINLEVDYEKGIHDPFLMKDMKKAVERILSAIGTEEKIVNQFLVGKIIFHIGATRALA